MICRLNQETVEEQQSQPFFNNFLITLGGDIPYQFFLRFEYWYGCVHHIHLQCQIHPLVLLWSGKTTWEQQTLFLGTSLFSAWKYLQGLFCISASLRLIWQHGCMPGLGLDLLMASLASSSLSRSRWSYGENVGVQENASYPLFHTDGTLSTFFRIPDNCMCPTSFPHISIL